MNERLAIGGGATTGFEELWDFVSTAEGEDGPVLQDGLSAAKCRLCRHGKWLEVYQLSVTVCGLTG